MTSDQILETIANANILDNKDIAFIERGLKLQEMYEIMLNEAIGLKKSGKEESSNIFDFKYQMYQNNKKHYCKDCKNCINVTSLSKDKKTKKYKCFKLQKDTYEYNSCDYWED